MSALADHAEELYCECCGGRLKIICTSLNCDDPLEARRKSKGPVVAPPVERHRRLRVFPGNLKLCRGECGQVKPIAEFYANQSQCIPCWKKRYHKRKVTA